MSLSIALLEIPSRVTLFDIPSRVALFDIPSRVALFDIPSLVALLEIPSLPFALLVIPSLLIAIIRQLFEFALKGDHVLVLDKAIDFKVFSVLDDVKVLHLFVMF